jgi:hypothetical protein
MMKKRRTPPALDSLLRVRFLAGVFKTRMSFLLFALNTPATLIKVYLVLSNHCSVTHSAGFDRRIPGRPLTSKLLHPAPMFLSSPINRVASPQITRCWASGGPKWPSRRDLATAKFNLDFIGRTPQVSI